ncbi:ABATE domain-containing protein [Nonomuraea sp. NPDC050310]|uniref:CGNR zinc finger domain-containing protein n=1 Tax=Nonomuraea sp. NPDC050310 TaxID=3154935 RepID=UPI0033C78DBD
MVHLAVALANTVRASTGDALAGPDGLAAWLREVRPRLRTPVTEADLDAITERDAAAARRVRDAVRALMAGAAEPDGHVAELNAACRAAPRWHELVWGEPPALATRTAQPAVPSALAEVAEQAILLLSGPDRELVRPCGAPGCVQFFLKEHPRREWCSAGCGNRVRVARHYARSRER